MKRLSTERMVMKKIVVSAIGKDRPGIVAGLTKALYDAGCNLEDSAMTLLEGEFAILLMAQMPPGMKASGLQAKLRETAKRLGLTLAVKMMDASIGPEKETKRSAMVRVSGADQTGIVHRVSALLAEHGVNIVDLSSRRIEGGPDKDKAVYIVQMDISLPASLSLAALQQALKKLGKEIGLDMDVQEMRVERL